MQRAAVGLVVAHSLVACGGGATEITCAKEPVRTDDGVTVHDSTCGSGEGAGRGDLISVSYRAAIQGRETFEQKEEPFPFRLGLGQVIEGWDEGLLGMQVGGVRRLTIPPEMGYGSAGLPPKIPPNATLVYDVELLSLKEAT